MYYISEYRFKCSIIGNSIQYNNLKQTTNIDNLLMELYLGGFDWQNNHDIFFSFHIILHHDLYFIFDI